MFLSIWSLAHRWSGCDAPPMPGNLVNRLSLLPVIFERAVPLRCNGPPGVFPGYFQRTIVRYTELNHLTDKGLYPVLRTRPGLAPPQICLPSTFSGTGHTCTSTHAFASGLLQAHIAVTPLPLATLRLRQAGYGLCPDFVSLLRTAPISSRALPGTQLWHCTDSKKRCRTCPSVRVTSEETSETS